MHSSSLLRRALAIKAIRLEKQIEAARCKVEKCSKALERVQNSPSFCDVQLICKDPEQLSTVSKLSLYHIPHSVLVSALEMERYFGTAQLLSMRADLAKVSFSLSVVGGKFV